MACGSCQAWHDPNVADGGLALAFQERCGVRLTRSRPLGQVVHVFTHRHLTLDVHAVEAVGEPRATWYTELAWLDADARAGEALSTLARKTVRLLG